MIAGLLARHTTHIRTSAHFDAFSISKQVYANNVDRYNISFHSLFYRLALLPPLAAISQEPLPVGRSRAGTHSMSGGPLGAIAMCISNAIGGGRLGAPISATGWGVDGSSNGDGVMSSIAPSQPLVPELVKLPPDACRVTFDDGVSSCVHVRVFSVANVSPAPLTIRLTPSPLVMAAASSAAQSAPIPRTARSTDAAPAAATTAATTRPSALRAPASSAMENSARSLPSVELGRICLFQLASNAGLPSPRFSRPDNAASISTWATVEEVAAKREQLHDRFESLPQRVTSVTLEDTGGSTATTSGGPPNAGGPSISAGGASIACTETAQPHSLTCDAISAANSCLTSQGTLTSALLADEASLAPVGPDSNSCIVLETGEDGASSRKDSATLSTRAACASCVLAAPCTASSFVRAQASNCASSSEAEAGGVCGTTALCVEATGSLRPAMPVDGQASHKEMPVGTSPCRPNAASLPIGCSGPSVAVHPIETSTDAQSVSAATHVSTVADASSSTVTDVDGLHISNLQGSDLVALATIFRDLHASPRRAAAAAAAIDGRPPGLQALSEALSAWACGDVAVSTPAAHIDACSGGHVPPSCAAADFEAAIVFMHTWLRRTVASLIRSGMLVPLNATNGEITLAPDEERVLLVRYEPADYSSSTNHCCNGIDTFSAVASTPDPANNVDGSSTSLLQRMNSGTALPTDSGPLSGQISIELVDYDKTLRAQHERRLARFFPSQDLPPPQTIRQLPVVAAVRLSAMDIGQRSINFGTCAVRQLREKTILLHNRSAAPLLYKVGAIADTHRVRLDAARRQS